MAAELVNRKHDVVVVDADREACEGVYIHTGAVAVRGLATEIGTLKEAGIEKADVAVGALYRDSDNLTFSLLARSCGVPRIIAKMRDPAYREVYRAAGVDVICDMISMFRAKVLSELESPWVRVVETIGECGTCLVLVDPPGWWPEEGLEVDQLAAIGMKEIASALVLPGRCSGGRSSGQPRRICPGDKFVVAADERAVARLREMLSQPPRELLALVQR